MVHVYGIPNCQTVKKARTWLDEQGIAYAFHNFKTETPSAPLLKHWLTHLDLSQLVNKRGTTWRKLSEAEQAALQDPTTAIDVLIAYTSVIKRPVIVVNDEPILLGFDADHYANTLLKP